MRCAKVLPLVYDDSLSYYETLGKVVKKVNELIDYVDKEYTKVVEANINKIINKIFGDILYDAEHERLNFSAQNYSIKDGAHVYDPDTSTMEIRPVLEEVE